MLSRIVAWGPVMLLALTAFLFVSTEFVPVGLLTGLGASFNMTAVEMGPMLTTYAAVVALSSLPAVLLFARCERKQLLLGLMAIFVIAHLICAWAPSYQWLTVGRVGIALAHALFWAIAPALAVRLAPKGQDAKALSLFATGCVLALVLGVPLGRVLGYWMGWRWIFVSFAVLTTIAMLILWRGLPNLPAQRSGDWRSLPELARNRALLWLYGLTVLLVTAHYSVFTYLEPLLQQHFGYQPNVTTTMMLLFGAAGFIGSALFGRYNNQAPRNLLGLSIAILGSCLALLAVAAQLLWLMLVLCVFWGASMMLVALSLQAKALKLANNATDVAMAIYSALFNVGIGGGALVGSLVASQYGLIANGSWAAALVLVAILPLWCLVQSRRRSAIAPKTTLPTG